MQIKERGKKVVCIKTEYVPEKLRTYGRQVASQESWMVTVSEDVRRQLSKEDVDELQKWLDDRAEKEKVDSVKRGLTLVASMQARAAEALDAGFGDDLSEERAAAIWESISQLQKALKKAGHPRPRPQKRQPAKRAVDTSQANLFQSGEKPD